MGTIYWIQRIGVLNDVCCIILMLMMFAFVIAWFPFMIGDDKERHSAKLFLRRLVGLAVIPLLIILFVPTKHDLYEIYGIGGAIDYIRSNDTAKGLPDKAIKALDAWLDENNNKK